MTFEAVPNPKFSFLPDSIINDQNSNQSFTIEFVLQSCSDQLMLP